MNEEVPQHPAPQPPPADDTSLRAPSDRTAREWITALEAAGFRCGLTNVLGQWIIHLPRDQATAARQAVEDYERDNRDWPPVAAPEPPAPATPATRSWSPLWVAGFLTACYLLLGAYNPDGAVLKAAAADAEAIRAGEYWRTITALTLHADSAHLLGNVATLILLGFALCHACGSGLAWTTILLSGAGGNALAAILFRPYGSSVGASTAGFGALGILCGLRLVAILRRDLGSALNLKRDLWRVLGGGLAMLALMGTGPNSDLAGHACGFLCGLLLGLPLAWTDKRQTPLLLHRLLELACLCTVMLCWRAVVSHLD